MGTLYRLVERNLMKKSPPSVRVAPKEAPSLMGQLKPHFRPTSGSLIAEWEAEVEEAKENA